MQLLLKTNSFATCAGSLRARRFLHANIKLTHVSLADVLSDVLASATEPVESLLHTIHYPPYMPWWGTIALGTILIRTTIWPLKVYVVRNQYRLLLASTTFNAELGNLQRPPSVHRSPTIPHPKRLAITAASRHHLWHATLRRYKCQPLRNLLPILLHLPLFLTYSAALRNLSAFPMLGLPTPLEPAIGMNAEGILWFADLTAPSLPLALLAMLSNAVLVELGRRKNGAILLAQRQNIPYLIMHSINLVSTLILMRLPVSINLYIIVANFITACENVVVQSLPLQAIFKDPSKKKVG